MSKTYLKGYTYEYHSKSIIRPSMVVLSNNLKYGIGRLESQIFIENKAIRVLITDGYKFLYDKTGFQSVKAAMNIAHSHMVKITESSR